jgi:hypothetical protein
MGFVGSVLYKFIDLRNKRLGAFYMKHIVKLDNETGNSIPVKQVEDFFARHTVQYLVCLNAEY